ncbi:MAG TPA: conserved phage C-terminal domain-containing protein [Candidatus Babeliales bacterium]|nr:conserved phage C-terminal domain-containing protein [Candidatus Babeliales bacterium]
MMRNFAKVSPQIWINDRGKQLKRLGIKAQFLAFYLSTNPHACMIGIYYLPIAFIAHETGIPYEEVITTLKQLEDINYCTYDKQSEYIWVHDMAFEQIDIELKPQDNRVKGVNDLFHALPDLPFLNEFLNIYSQPFHIKSKEKQGSDLVVPSEPLPSKEKENEIEKEKENKKENENDQHKNQNNDECVSVKNINSCKENNIVSDDSDDDELLSPEEKAIRILKFFNEKVRTTYPPIKEFLNPILSHLNAGVTTEQCHYVITNKYNEWVENDDMKKHLKIRVIFGSNFNKYLSELRKPKVKDSHENETALSCM